MQAVRRINENGNPPSEAALSTIIHVACHPDPSCGKDIVLWDDILAAFKADVVHIRSGTFVLPFLKGPDLKNLDPLRIAAISGTTLDVVVREQSGEQELSMKSIQKALPSMPLETSSSTTTTTSSPAGTIRRNPADGLVEAAMQNYTHIENPTTASPRRGPQAVLDSQASATTRNERTGTAPLTGQPEQQTKTPQQQHSSAFTQKFVDTETMAKLGDKDAQFALGEMYKDGQGAPQNYSLALEWYLKAANQGHIVAQYSVGKRYQNGQGVPRDYRQAMEWHLKAANQGNASAQNEVGFMFNHGQGVDQDWTKAMDWYRKSAALGSAAAQCNIGFMYSQGLDVPQDHALAMEWYRKAATQGSIAALDNIGMLYENGRGVPEDKAKAMEWYKKAADKGHARAKESLQRLEEEGVTIQVEKKRGLLDRFFK